MTRVETNNVVELIEQLQTLLAGFAGENDLKVGPHMLAHGIEEALDAIQSLSDRIDGLQDTIVTLWHQAPSEDRSLHECLGMTFDEYSAWANPSASLTQGGKNV